MANHNSVNPATKIVRCPGCGGDSVYAPSNAHRPFCSTRCKNGDLGAWASEGFRLAVEAPLDDSPLHNNDDDAMDDVEQKPRG